MLAEILRRDRGRVALHEAGHLVAALACGGYVLRAEVRETHGRVLVAGLQGTPGQAIFALAGAAAADADETGWCARDHVPAGLVSGPDEKELAQGLACWPSLLAAWDATRRVVCDNWRAILLFTEVLLKRPVLTCFDLELILDDHGVRDWIVPAKLPHSHVA